MTEPKRGEGGSWWTTLPGILTGLAAVLTALGTLVVALDQVDLLPRRSPTESRTPPPAVPRGQAARPEASATPAPREASGNAMAPSAGQGAGAPPRTHSGMVDGVGVEILATRQGTDRGMVLVELEYRVTTGLDPFRHDPVRFVRLVSGGVPVAASSAPRPLDLPADSQQTVRVGFALRAGPASTITFRFGHGDPIDLPPRWPE